jgi:predicted phosphodiesterase
MTTLVVSDLHLGMSAGRDLLRRADVRARLLARAAEAERVVLLGDTIELRQAPLRQALAAARPFFEELGAALGSGGEVLLIPGNHDHRLIAGWHEWRHAEMDAPLDLEQHIMPRDDEPIGVLAGWLAPTPLTLAYPGAWLRADVYAMHGHFLDVHSTVPTLERLAIGALARARAPLPERPSAGDYDAALAPLYALVHELAQRPGRGSVDAGEPSRRRPALRGLLQPGRGDRPPRLARLGPALPAVLAALNALGIGPLRANVRPEDLTAAGLQAMARVCTNLQIAADYVVFGHLHRPGPWPDRDDAAPWTTSTGTRLVNTGSWILEYPLLRADSTRAYSAGTCVEVPGSGPPTVVRVLEDLALVSENPEVRSRLDDVPPIAA